MGAEHEATAKESSRRFSCRSDLAQTVPTNQVEAELVRSLRIGHAGTRTNDAAECIRTVGHRTRTADHLHLVNGLGVEIGRRCTGTAL